MSDRKRSHVANVAEVEPTRVEAEPRFCADRRSLSRAAGGRHIGASHYRVPPGKTAWPAHFHAANEEAIFVLHGQGTLRLGDERISVRTGDWIALPAEPRAHQLINDGTEDLVYLCVSTQTPTDVCVYPDSNKIGVFGGAAPGGDAQRRFVSGYFRAGSTVPYYDGET